jgi:hypothetical protein
MEIVCRISIHICQIPEGIRGGPRHDEGISRRGSARARRNHKRLGALNVDETAERIVKRTP